MSMSSTRGNWEIHIYNQFHHAFEVNHWVVELHKGSYNWPDSCLLDLDSFDHDQNELRGQTLEDLVSEAIRAIKGEQK